MMPVTPNSEADEAAAVVTTAVTPPLTSAPAAVAVTSCGGTIVAGGTDNADSANLHTGGENGDQGKDGGVEDSFDALLRSGLTNGSVAVMKTEATTADFLTAASCDDDLDGTSTVFGR
jgi:hypothetical protein